MPRGPARARPGRRPPSSCRGRARGSGGRPSPWPAAARAGRRRPRGRRRPGRPGRRARPPRPGSRGRRSAGRRLRRPCPGSRRSSPPSRRGGSGGRSLGIRAQLVGDVVLGGGGAGDARAARRPHHQLVPAEPVAVGRDAGRCTRRSSPVDRARPRARGTRRRSAAPRRPPWPGRTSAVWETGATATRRPSTVSSISAARSRARGGGVGAQPARVLDGRALAEGRDLGHVDHLAQVELAAAGLDAQVAVDREVAQRVRRRDGGPAERAGRPGATSATRSAPHGASLASSRRATGAQRTEKAGLSSRACEQPLRGPTPASPAHGRGHAGVEEHQRVLRAEAQAAGGVAVALGAAAGAGQDPAEHLVADRRRAARARARRARAHVGRAGPRASARIRATSRLNVRAVGGQQLLHRLGEGEVVADGLGRARGRGGRRRAPAGYSGSGSRSIARE